NAIDRWIDDVIYQGNEKQDETRIRRLHRRGDQVHAEPVQIHLLCLQGPLDPITHSRKGPEKENENVNHRDTPYRDEALAAERFAQITEAGRPDVHHFVATSPEKYCRDEHRYARNSKAPTRTEIRIGQQPGAKERGDERAGVDRKIKPAEHFREQVLVRFTKLVANVGRDARF